jgi:broad specificity phosphatase PhoE
MLAFGRARQTADRVKRVLPLAARETVRLLEVPIGSRDGVTHFEIENGFPGVLDGSDAFEWYFRSPDGESFDAACARAEEWVERIPCPAVAISAGPWRRIK